MKWSIRVHSNWNPSNNDIFFFNHLMNGLFNHLIIRDNEISIIENGISDSKGVKYSINYQYNHPFLELIISSKSWKKQNPHQLGPPILFLIEDYFKLDTSTWLYLETLSEEEILAVENIERTITPFKIMDRLKSININTNILKPTIEWRAKKHSYSCDFYVGSKNEFVDIVDFWISFLAWESYSEIDYNDLSYILKRGYFNTENGKCIPIDKVDINHDIEYISSIRKWFNHEDIKKCYLMRTDWDFRVILFTLENKFLIYHCWTLE